MTEKMLVTQALDERDLLIKKIGDKIDAMKVVDTKRKNEERTAAERLSEEEFGAGALAAYQSVSDLIDRYQRIDAAIIASNAATKIQTTRGEFTVAAAIALRSRLRCGGPCGEADFEDSLIEQMQRQYDAAVRTAEQKNKAIEQQAENMRLSILGKDSRTKDSRPLDVVDAYIRENTTEVIDPLDVNGKIRQIQEKVDTLMTELDTQIKVSNATTFVEI